MSEAITLRRYQVELLEGVHEAFLGGARYVCMCSPTGSGKTVVFSEFVSRARHNHPEWNILVCAHRRELVLQISGGFRDMGIAHAVLMADMPGYVPGARLVVASIDTLVNRPNEIGRKWDLVIIDECHRAPIASYQTVMQSAAWVIGATATPYRTDGKHLGFQALVQGPQIAELVADGFLARPLQFSRLPPDLSGVKHRGDDYDEDELGSAMCDPEAVRHVIEAWLDHAARRRTLVFAVNIPHAKMLEAAFRAAGASVAMVDGKTSTSMRDATVAQFKSGTLQVIVNCLVYTEGVDLPICDAIVLARPTLSRVLWKQMCGRGLRLCDETGKTDCIVLDCAGCYRQHGSLLEDERLSLDDPPEAVGYRIECIRCHERVSPRDDKCPHCGAPIPKGTREHDLGLPEDPMFKEIVGEMVNFDDAAVVWHALATKAWQAWPRKVP